MKLKGPQVRLPSDIIQIVKSQTQRDNFESSKRKPTHHIQ